MSAASDPDREQATPVSDAADALAGAAFVRLVAGANGDALAAAGVLGRALDARDTPFQATVTAPLADADRRTEADLTLSVGHDAPAAVTVPGSARAFAIARELDATPDPTLALAGTLVAGDRDERVLDAAEATGLERHPGVGVPVTDLPDGLAHSTLFVAPFSGDRDAAGEALAELDDGEGDDRRRVASLVALAVVGDESATERSSHAVQRALRPYEGEQCPFATVEGYADVLDAAARQSPGIGVALALGDDGVRDQALAAWRDHATRANAALSRAECNRYAGCYVVRGDVMPVGTVARLVADFRSPEPVVLAVGDGVAAAQATDGRDLDGPVTEAAKRVDGATAATGRQTRVRFAGDPEEFVAALREAL